VSFRDRDVEKKSDKLAQKRIAFGVCGGIGSVEVVRIVRELRRHGAEVTVFITPGVTRFVGELSLAWSSGRSVVSELGADVDGLEDFDVVVIAPLTLNTLSKLSLGLCDNPVTMVTASHLGKQRKCILFPTMHASLANHPRLAEHLEKLQSWGAVVHFPVLEEGRMKMPSPEQVVTIVLEHGTSIRN